MDSSPRPFVMSFFQPISFCIPTSWSNENKAAIFALFLRRLVSPLQIVLMSLCTWILTHPSSQTLRPLGAQIVPSSVCTCASSPARSTASLPGKRSEDNVGVVTRIRRRTKSGSLLRHKWRSAHWRIAVSSIGIVCRHYESKIQTSSVRFILLNDGKLSRGNSLLGDRVAFQIRGIFTLTTSRQRMRLTLLLKMSKAGSWSSQGSPSVCIKSSIADTETGAVNVSYSL